MNANRFPSDLRRKADELKRYCINEFPSVAGRKILRFIDGNFRAQGWQGAGFQPWKPNQRGGRILVNKGSLRRSFRMQAQSGTVRVYSTSRYAAVHNRGFNGTVNVKAHERRQFTARKIGTGNFTKTGKERTKTIHEHTGTIQVAAHTRKMSIPKRQFMPQSYNDSPVLMNAIRREIINTTKKIFG